MIYWDPEIARYRDENGRIIPRAAVRKALAASQERSATAVGELATMLDDRVIDEDDWLGMMRTQVKEEAIRQYMTGRGGYLSMDATDWALIGAALAVQYRYLDGFKDDLPDMTTDEIASRAVLYVSWARSMMSKASDIAHEFAGYAFESWHTTANESCQGCIRLESLGRVALGTLGQPGDGNTECLTRCKCYKRYWKAQ